MHAQQARSVVQERHSLVVYVRLLLTKRFDSILGLNRPLPDVF